MTRPSHMPPRDLTRRGLFSALFATPAAPTSPPLQVPVLRVINKHSTSQPADYARFSASVWDPAVQTFRSNGIEIGAAQTTGEIRRYPSGQPRFFGLERKVLNIVLTDVIPLDWDNGRSLAGLTTIYEGYHLILIALRNAYTNHLPFLAVNTVVHELLHAFRGDIFHRRSGFLQGADREAAVDWQATRLWLFGRLPGIEDSARVYVQGLVSGVRSATP